MNAPIKLGILISGGGSTAKSIVDATKSGGQLHGKVEPVCVIASKADCGGIKKLGPDGEGLPVVVINPKGKNDEAAGKKMIAALHQYGANFVSQNGWLPITPENVVKEFDGRIINQHPGPLNKGNFDFGGKGMHGMFVHAARLLFAKLTGENLWTEAVAHKVTSEVDGGEVIQKVRIPITNDMLDFNIANLTDGKFIEKVKALQARVLPYEHQVQRDVLEDTAIAASNGTELRPLSERLPWHGHNAVKDTKEAVAEANLKKLLAAA